MLESITPHATSRAQWGPYNSVLGHRLELLGLLIVICGHLSVETNETLLAFLVDCPLVKHAGLSLRKSGTIEVLTRRRSAGISVLPSHWRQILHDVCGARVPVLDDHLRTCPEMRARPLLRILQWTTIGPIFLSHVQVGSRRRSLTRHIGRRRWLVIIDRWPPLSNILSYVFNRCGC